MFAQTPRTRRGAGGLGIGLSLTRSLRRCTAAPSMPAAKAWAGEASSSCALPVVLEGELIDSPGEACRPRFIRKRKKMLVVDDNVDAANTLEALLGMDGSVTTAYDGVAAVAPR
jgi:hypothetical protein